MTTILFIVALIAGAGAFVAVRDRMARVSTSGPLAAQVGYYAWYAAITTVGAGLSVLLLYALSAGPIVHALTVGAVPDDIRALDPARLSDFMADARDLAAGAGPRDPSAVLIQTAEQLRAFNDAGRWVAAAAVLAALVVGFGVGWSGARRDMRARDRVDALIKAGLIACSAVAVLTTFGIVSSLFWESLRFFARVPVFEFLFGLQWSPQTALRADQVGASGAFGAVPLFYGTMMITVIALAVAGPVGILSAIYLSEYAGSRTRGVVKPVLELLAGVPTVVYGFFALLTVGPFIRQVAEGAGLDAPTQSALAAGLVMGVMIIPFVSSLSDDVINAVPQSLRDGSYAMGATKSETISRVIMPAALPGVMGALLLAVSRAVGETMIVVMAAGRAANMPINPLESVTTITVQIVALLTGDQEFDSPKTLSAFALGLVLFAITLVMNVIALRIVQRYRERYE